MKEKTHDGHHRLQETPWRRIISIFLLLIALATVFSVAHDSDFVNAIPATYRIGLEWGLCILWFVIGVWLIRSLRRIITQVASNGAKSDIRVALLISRAFSAVGYSFVFVVALHLLHIKVGSILVGGAVTGVIVGIGAQSTLSNLFAGVVLFTLRPFSIGQTILIRTYLFGGVEYSGTVVDVNWYYTVLMESGQRRILPNSAVIVAAISIVSDSGLQLYYVPLPYSTPLPQFEKDLKAATDGQARVSIKEFGQDTYTVQVKVPYGDGGDLLREILWKHQASQGRSDAQQT